MHNSLPKINWNDLEVHDILGTGASGIISKALWKSEQKEIAVKVFKGEVTSDGLPHDEMLTCIEAGEHDNLVSVIGQIEKHPEEKEGLVLGLIPKNYKNLGMPPSFESCTRDTFQKGTSFSIEDIVTITKGVSSAMQHLHKNEIMHGDLYAHNILVDDNAHALLGDFGAATLYEKHATYSEFFEKMDVRAFGCLLDDLLERIKESDKNHSTYSKLLSLKEISLSYSYKSRLFFSEASNYLAKLP